MRKTSGKYYARFYDRTRHPKRKTWPLRTNRQDVARRRLVKLERAYEDGSFDPWRGGYLFEALTVEEAAERFLEAKRVQGLRPNSLSAYEYATDGLIDLLPPGQMVQYLSGEDIRPYVYDQTKSNSTQLHRYRHLNAWLNWCEDEGFLPDGNPMDEVDKPRKQEKRPAFLSPDDLKRLLAAIDRYAESRNGKPGKNPADQWIKGLVRVAVSTGLRRNELLSLRWKDINLDRGFLWVRNREEEGFRTKSGSERMVPLAEDAQRVLTRLEEERKPSVHDRVFLDDRGREIRPDRVSSRFKHYVRYADLPDAERLTFHSLRHTCASWLAMKGTPMRIIQGILGHSSINMTEIYSHLRPEVMTRAVHETFGELDL